MGLLANHLDQQNQVRQTIRLALSHFDRINLSPADSELLSAAANRAYSDELLLEKFRLWAEEREDDVLLFHVKRFFEQESIPRLAREERDQTHRRETIESEVKNAARDRVKQMFGLRVTVLAAQHGLDTNAKLGEFLTVSEEQARKWRSGENKPQLATLRLIAERFSVRIEYLTGLIDTPN
jgi:DNA-binding transcriptional regulator YiaG